MKTVWMVLSVVAAAVLVSCAPGANGLMDVAGASGGVAGFWLGLWHGLIAPITFIVSLFTSNVQIYEVHNSGGWYNFGYLLGLSVVFHGPLRAARGRRWRGRV